MKRVIIGSDETIRFTQYITFDVEVPMPAGVYSSTEAVTDLFPGREQFLSDAVKILEDEYHFDVVEEGNPPKKGHLSDRSDSASVYVNAFYNLENAVEPLKRVGVTDTSIPKGKTFIVECFIHFRFSDHELYDVGDADHNAYLNQNVKDHIANHPVSFVEKEVNVVVPEATLHRAYSEALDDMRDSLDIYIVGWVAKAKRRLAQGDR